jgi:hypothetical protein
MTSAKKIAANTRNAARSTGPRSAFGKKRVSRNAYRHGLCQSAASQQQFNEDVENRTREFAEGSCDPFTLDKARTVAEAEVDILRAIRAKIAVFQRTYVFGALDPARFSDRAIKRWFKAFDRGLDPALSVAMEGVPEPMPTDVSGRMTEAIRRAMPELLKIDRYERRAAVRRDRAVCELCRSLGYRVP